jgi:hypothetical protein
MNFKFIIIIVYIKMEESINKTLLLKKITNNGLYLKHLSLQLKNNYEIVMTSVKMMEMHWNMHQKN